MRLSRQRIMCYSCAGDAEARLCGFMADVIVELAIHVAIAPHSDNSANDVNCVKMPNNVEMLNDRHRPNSENHSDLSHSPYSWGVVRGTRSKKMLRRPKKRREHCRANGMARQMKIQCCAGDGERVACLRVAFDTAAVSLALRQLG